MGVTAASGGAGLTPPAPLHDGHDFTDFDSGEPALDEWLRRRARANQRAGASRTFVLCRGQGVVGYYCLAAGAVALAAAPGRIRRNMPDPIPMAVLGRLVVDRTLHGQGIGRALLRDAARRTIQASEALAVRGLLVQALNDGAAGFYLACGFVPSPGESRVLMATMTDLVAALG